MKLSDVEIADTFKIGEYEFIKFQKRFLNSVVVMRHSICDVPFCSFERNGIVMESMDGYGNYERSDVQFHLNKWIFREIARLVGRNNIKEFEQYGMKELISIPTLEFFEESKDVFDRYKTLPWWLRTKPGSRLPDEAIFVDIKNEIQLQDIPSEYLPNGIRPMLLLSSDIEVKQ